MLKRTSKVGNSGVENYHQCNICLLYHFFFKLFKISFVFSYKFLLKKKFFFKKSLFSSSGTQIKKRKILHSLATLEICCHLLESFHLSCCQTVFFLQMISVLDVKCAKKKLVILELY